MPEKDEYEGETEPVRRATRDDIVAVMERYATPTERLREADWPGLARVIVKEARRFKLEVPHDLALWAGYRKSPPPLRLVIGGAKVRASGRL